MSEKWGKIHSLRRKRKDNKIGDEKKSQKRKGNYFIGEISRSEMEIQINEINL
jgi:hypothetical protein